MRKIKITEQEYNQFMENNQIIYLGDLFPKDGNLKKFQKLLSSYDLCETKLISYKQNYFLYDDVRNMIQRYLENFSYKVYKEIETVMEEEVSKEIKESASNELC